MSVVVLETLYFLTKKETKSVSIGYDATESLQPCVWISKCGETKLRLDEYKWNKLKELQPRIHEHFYGTIPQPDVSRLDENFSLHFLTKHNNKLICIEESEWPIVGGNQVYTDKYLWLSKKSWTALWNLQECIDFNLARCISTADSLRNLYEALARYINESYGNQLRESYGDIGKLQKYLKTLDTTQLLQGHEGFDAPRALLEMKTLCVNELSHFVQYYCVSE